MNDTVNCFKFKNVSGNEDLKCKYVASNVCMLV